MLCSCCTIYRTPPSQVPNSRTYRTNGKTQVNVVNIQESVPRNSPLPLPLHPSSPPPPHLLLIIRWYCVSMTINNLHNMYHIVIHPLLQSSPRHSPPMPFHMYMTSMSHLVPHFPISCSCIYNNPATTEHFSFTLHTSIPYLFFFMFNIQYFNVKLITEFNFKFIGFLFSHNAIPISNTLCAMWCYRISSIHTWQGQRIHIADGFPFKYVQSSRDHRFRRRRPSSAWIVLVRRYVWPLCSWWSCLLLGAERDRGNVSKGLRLFLIFSEPRELLVESLSRAVQWRKKRFKHRNQRHSHSAAEHGDQVSGGWACETQFNIFCRFYCIFAKIIASSFQRTAFQQRANVKLGIKSDTFNNNLCSYCTYIY